MVEIRWSPKAGDQFRDICTYLENTSPSYANSFAKKVIITVENLTKYPKIGRKVPELNNPHIRELIINGYRIMYKISRTTVEIITIFHGSRIFRPP